MSLMAHGTIPCGSPKSRLMECNAHTSTLGGSMTSPLGSLLTDGVCTFNAATINHFMLCAYVILKSGDIVAIEKLLNLKGHNALYPCRSCNICGLHNVTGRGKFYYAALGTPNLEHQEHPSMDPRDLPLHTHEEFLTAIADLKSTATKGRNKQIAKLSGIRGQPAMDRVSSINYANSIPWEWMHLFLENVIPTLVNLWTGNFKGKDTGAENYEFTPHIWEKIGEETVDAVKDIPAAFVQVLGNIALDRSSFIAESWGFWFVYLAPILLRNKFQGPKYYDHMVSLVRLMKLMVKFQLQADEIDETEEGLIQWVEFYYYQYDEARLPACTLPIHGLLHVAANIRFCGPVWTSWTFAME
ncbi:hypothetical protein PAXINDRAFT_158259 [Paxillus involutus ATCC 200175]|uniref:Uncharacterized protein n=1 Tax=Paxillus involutus ATCC 200175 TaxID=664439 RepID=A0A0C9SNI4_PAXIN|nr:hypothetical protein PAXINDRAFT_158259 [Paxillus involutus ATCC 200175]